jgi:glycosyltransferase involved in cell wall biosynthesis
VDIAFAALDRVRKALPNLRILLFGTERISANLMPPPGAEFHYRPAQSELRKIYARSDAWLCGSRQDGFHLPLLEAMACRCPVVTSRVGGATEFVEHGVNGFLVDVNDSVDLAEKLVQLLKLPENDWLTMSSNALSTARRYTWEDATDLLQNALFEITSSSRVPCL